MTILYKKLSQQQQQQRGFVHLGLLFPKETVDKIDQLKGRYYSRNKYLLKIVEEHLLNENNNENNENNNDNIDGVKGSQVLQTYPTTTPTPFSTAQNTVLIPKEVSER